MATINTINRHQAVEGASNNMSVENAIRDAAHVIFRYAETIRDGKLPDDALSAARLLLALTDLGERIELVAEYHGLSGGDKGDPFSGK